MLNKKECSFKFATVHSSTNSAQRCCKSVYWWVGGEDHPPTQRTTLAVPVCTRLILVQFKLVMLRRNHSDGILYHSLQSLLHRCLNSRSYKNGFQTLKKFGTKNNFQPGSCFNFRASLKYIYCNEYLLAIWSYANKTQHWL